MPSEQNCPKQEETGQRRSPGAGPAPRPSHTHLVLEVDAQPTVEAEGPQGGALAQARRAAIRQLQDGLQIPLPDRTPQAGLRPSSPPGRRGHRGPERRAGTTPRGVLRSPRRLPLPGLPQSSKETAPHGHCPRSPGPPDRALPSHASHTRPPCPLLARGGLWHDRTGQQQPGLAGGESRDGE